MIAYCVVDPAFDDRGRRVGVFRFWTGDPSRAAEVASAAPGRVIEEHADDAIPEKVRANLERHR